MAENKIQREIPAVTHHMQSDCGQPVARECTSCHQWDTTYFAENGEVGCYTCGIHPDLPAEPSPGFLAHAAQQPRQIAAPLPPWKTAQ